MSFFLEGSSHLSGKLILTIPCKQVITPKYRRILKESIIMTNQTKQELLKEEIMMKKICQKFTQKELERIQIENEINLKKKFLKIKKRLKRSIQNQSQMKATQKNSEVIKFLNSNIQQSSLSSLAKSYIQNIQIGVKYQNKLALKLASIMEAQQINEEKEKCRKLLNEQNNNPLNSPILNKINFAIDRNIKARQLSQVIQSENDNSKFRKERNTTQTFQRGSMIPFNKQGCRKDKRIISHHYGLMNPNIFSKIEVGHYEPRSRVQTLKHKTN